MEPPSKPSTSLFDVYLRLRPSPVVDAQRFLEVEASESHAPTHITIRPPASDHRKRAVEKFAFTRVFQEDAAQLELFRGTGIIPLIEGVLGAEGREGRNGLLATLGVTGSGKSHTILGSKSQRGLTQLSLDVLFQCGGANIVHPSATNSGFPTLCAADVSEAQLLPASLFLESVYGDGTSSERGTSRATTPMPVGVQPSSFSSPTPQSTATSVQPSSRGPYPFLSQFRMSQNSFISSLEKEYNISAKPIASFARMTRSVAKKTSDYMKDSSFLSAPTSKRYIPRLSALPQYPSVDDIAVKVDRTADYAIVISMYEVYNDRIFDLLASSASKGAIPRRRALLFKSTEHSPDRKVVAGLKKIICGSLDEANMVLETGLTERRVAGTGSNAVSSRSHGFFCVEVKKRRRGVVMGPWTSSALTIVDLAGSERARTAKTAGATLAEAGKINESLMYLGQCMQMQSDNASHSESNKPQNIVPFRQCKLTELLFSNSFPSSNSHQYHHKAPQKSIMVVAADPVGDFNATSQILRYSALAREVTVPRIPSVTSTILAGVPAGKGQGGYFSGRITPSAAQEELEHALTEMAKLREELDISQLRLREEMQRRRDTEASWKVAEERVAEVEQEVREEVWQEMEERLVQEQARWRQARNEELDRNDEHLDRKLDILSRGVDVEVYEDPEPTNDERVSELEDENETLRARVQLLEREQGLRSPSKKMRVLKARKWEGMEGGLDGSP
ncbi:hypothetical protein LTR66_000059 [Elasticomyces elasticus]|nr:hypothetical protein LTR66_000059 [Elasticomyces elasticus]